MNQPKKLEHKLLLQILSVLIAVIIWFVIVYTENPTREAAINDIKIQYLGESHLFDAGFILVNKAAIPDASIVVKGSRNELMEALKETTAVVDLSDINGAGQYKLPVAYNLPSNNLHITKRKTPTVAVTIESVETKEVPVKILQIGGEKDKTHIVQSVPAQKSVVVSGASSDIGQISEAVISVDITTVKQDVEQKYSYILADSQGNEVNPVNEVSVADEVVSVANRVLIRKTIPVEVTFPRELTEKYSIHIQSLSQEQADIGVTAEDAAPEKLTAEFSGPVEEGQDTYQVSLKAPEGIYVPEESLTIEMKAEVKKKTVKSVEIPVRVDNESNLAYEITPQNVSVQARGPEDKLNLDSIEAVLHLSGLPKGEHRLQVEVKSKDMDVDILNDIYVTVKIF